MVLIFSMTCVTFFLCQDVLSTVGFRYIVDNICGLRSFRKKNSYTVMSSKLITGHMPSLRPRYAVGIETRLEPDAMPTWSKNQSEIEIKLIKL
jgi:hypothetical protein